MNRFTDPQLYRSDWGTPPVIFDPLNDFFKFTLDVCASEWNKKCERYFTQEQDGLKQPWEDNICWLNPPYGRNNIVQWLKRAHEETAASTVVLLPAWVETNWFQENIIYFGCPFLCIPQRVAFVDPRTRQVGANNPGGSIIAVINSRWHKLDLPQFFGSLWLETIE